MSVAQQTAAFAAALSSALLERNIRQERLAVLVDVSAATMSRWVRGQILPAPKQVFEMERVLELSPGALSRILGYVPVDLLDDYLPGRSAIESAVKLTDELDETGRKLVLIVLQDQLAHARRSRRESGNRPSKADRKQRALAPTAQPN